MNGVSGIAGIVPPPAAGPTRHVQSKEKTLTNDVYRHEKLAKKELKAANKLEHKAQKEHERLAKALRKGDIEGAEKHSNLEETLKAEAQQHKVKAEKEQVARGNSAYNLEATKLSGSGGIARCVDGAPAVLTSSNYNSYRPTGYGRAW